MILRTISSSDLAEKRLPKSRADLALAERIWSQLRDIEFEEDDPLPLWDREKRVVIPQPMRGEVWDWSQGRCFYCGTSLHPFDDFHIDHALPISRGGTTCLRNLVASCRVCNLAKRDRTVSEWRATGRRLWCDEQAGVWDDYCSAWETDGAWTG